MMVKSEKVDFYKSHISNILSSQHSLVTDTLYEQENSGWFRYAVELKR